MNLSQPSRLLRVSKNSKQFQEHSWYCFLGFLKTDWGSSPIHPSYVYIEVVIAEKISFYINILQWLEICSCSCQTNYLFLDTVWQQSSKFKNGFMYRFFFVGTMNYKMNTMKAIHFVLTCSARLNQNTEATIWRKLFLFHLINPTRQSK